MYYVQKNTAAPSVGGRLRYGIIQTYLRIRNVWMQINHWCIKESFRIVPKISSGKLIRSLTIYKITFHSISRKNFNLKKEGASYSPFQNLKLLCSYLLHKLKIKFQSSFQMLIVLKIDITTFHVVNTQILVKTNSSKPNKVSKDY